MGGVGLVLINPGGDGVLVRPNVVCGANHPVRPRIQAGQGGPGKGHEVGGAARHKKGIVRRQGDDHAALAAFGEQAEAVIKELAEDGEEGVVRGRQTNVRRHIGDEEASVGGHGWRGTCGRDGNGVAHRLVRNQVAGGADLTVEDDTRRLGVARGAANGERPGPVRVEGGSLGRPPALGGGVDHGPVGSAEGFLTRHQVVEPALHRAQPIGQQGIVIQLGERIRPCGMGFRQQDLLEDELKVVLDEFHGWRLIAGGMATRRLKVRLIGVDQLGRFFRWLLEKSEPSYLGLW